SGLSIQVSPCGLSLLPRTFTKVTEAALAPLREVGICILSYLGDWLILAHSRGSVCTLRDAFLNHVAQLGLQVIWEKSKLSSVQCFSFLCVDSVTVLHVLPRLYIVSTAMRENTQIQYIGSFHVPGLLGHMASSAAVTLLGPQGLVSASAALASNYLELLTTLRALKGIQALFRAS
ncbi:hypothetical protein M9458_029537, partial [Cirrhinus mrigala]